MATANPKRPTLDFERGTRAAELARELAALARSSKLADTALAVPLEARWDWAARAEPFRVWKAPDRRR